MSAVDPHHPDGSNNAYDYN